MVRFSLSAKQFMHRTSTHQQRRDRNFNFITSTLIGIVIALNSPAASRSSLFTRHFARRCRRESDLCTYRGGPSRRRTATCLRSVAHVRQQYPTTSWSKSFDIAIKREKDSGSADDARRLSAGQFSATRFT